MKFTDGLWHQRDGISALHPAEAYDIATDAGSLTVHAPVRHVRSRFDTIDMPVITVNAWSPMPDVIAVRIGHLLGEQPVTPQFPIAVDPATEVVIAQDDTSATLTSGALSVRLRRGDDWRLDFLAGGRVLTGSGDRGMGLIHTDAGADYVHEQLDLGVDEAVYGLGERFGPLVKNGQAVDIWNEDGHTSTQLAYKNVPFYLTNHGYGVLVNHPGRVSFEVASEMVSRVQFSVPGQSLEYLVIYGPTPKDVLRRYTALTGRPALPPAWSFGLWLTTSFTTSYTEETVTSFINGMAQRDLPLSVFHFDTFWMREFNWCDFEWDTRAFPDPAGMLKRLKERGLHISLWINPYIAQRSPLFAEGAARGYLVRKADGDVWQWDRWQAGMGLVDFTNPDACAWYAGKLRALLDMGVDCFKSDFGERIPTDVVYFDGSDPVRMHNFYSYLYNETVFEVLREYRGEHEAIVFARSATVGGQRFPVHWGGDSCATFESMAESLRGGLSLSASGFGYWSHDIGGFEGRPDAALFKRWIPFGLLSSHSRLHGNESYRVPWLFDDEAVDVLRLFTKLKHRLMPYLYQAALVAHGQGIPVMRPMVVDFPDDPAVTYLERQYMLGDSLLVAPVFNAGGDTAYYVPAGRWTRLRTGETIDGPAWIRERHGFDSVPLLVRPGTVIPLGEREDRPDYAYHDGVSLHVYQLADGQRVTVPVPTTGGTRATTFEVTRDGGTVRVVRDGPALPWRVVLAGASPVTVDVPAGESTCEASLA
jgi:alpha-D-xyloside xylohydrolase